MCRRGRERVTDTTDAPDVPRWSTADVHESLDARTFTDAMERGAAEVDRLVALYDELGVRATDPRPPADTDGATADRVIDGYNRVAKQMLVLDSYVYAIVSTDSRHEHAQSLLSEIEAIDARLRPLIARLADWVDALGPDELGEVSQQAREHAGPLPGWPRGRRTR